jgi:hypothetical protein
MSYGNNVTVIQLDRPGTTLICGENLDDTADGSSANGTGKAQPLHCKVKIPNGWTTIGECEVGTIVSTPRGTAATITHVFPQGVRPVYKITFVDGRSTEADEDHLWACFSHRWGDQYTRGNKIISTKQLKEFVDTSHSKKKPWYNIFVPFIEPMNTEDISLPIDPYLLGTLLGDGGITARTVSFASDDSEIVETVNNILTTDFQQQLRKFGTNNKCTYTICNERTRSRGNKLSEQLDNLGLLGTSSSTKFIPECYLNSSTSQKLKLLSGLFDTDGTVEKTGGISISTASDQLAKQIQTLIWSIGGQATINTRQTRYKKNNKTVECQLTHQVYVHYKEPQKLFTLQRKLERISPNYQYRNKGLRVASVEYVRQDFTQCIAIDDPAHLYITDDYIVTHNTTVVNAICYGVYDRPISRINKDNLVNNINKKNMEVTLEFTKDKKTYIIKRARKQKVGAAGNTVHLWEDGKDITLDSVDHTNSLIEKIIGVPYELFVRIVVFSANHQPFLDLPVKSQTGPNQTDIIEELFNLTMLSEKANVLNKMIKDTDQKIEIQKTRIEGLEREHIRHQQQLENAKKRVTTWEINNKQQIATIQQKLDSIRNIDLETEQNLHAALDEIGSKLSKAIEEQKTTEREHRLLSQSLHKAENELVHLQDEKCPYCLQQFADAGSKIAETKQKADQHRQTIQQHTDKLAELKVSIQTFTIEYKSLQAQLTIDNLDELMEVKNQSVKYAEKIAELEAAMNPFIEPLEELENMALGTIDYDELNKLTKLSEHQKFLQKLLTKKDSFVRKALLNKNIPYLNSRLNSALTTLGLPHKVDFTHEMTASISQLGRPLDFGNLSNGQRARVNLALSFAFRDVLENLHTKFNICMLDEALDVGLDDIGVQMAARFLKKKARDERISLYIISHRSEVDGIFDRTMTVQMNKGFSYIKED